VKLAAARVAAILFAASVACGGARPEEAPAAAAPRGAPAASSDLLVFEKKLGRGKEDLYLVPAQGGLERRLTEHPGIDILPRFAPDGRRVVFSSDRSGRFQLWELSLEGGPPTRLRRNDAEEWQADPSPDGSRIAFLSDQDGPISLFILDRRTGATRLLVRHGARTDLGNPNWSPDGGRIVFSSNKGVAGHHVYVVDVATGEETRESGYLAGACEPRFSRDGRRVAFVDRSHLSRDHSRIVERDLAGGEERVLVDWPALNYDPVYSPDGAEIAFASTVAGENAIYRMRLSDGKSWRVTFGPGASRHPDYAPRRH
jgi:Tol biopolymer transport system component